MNKSLETELHISRYIIIYKLVLGLLETLLGLGIIIFGRQIVNIYQNFKSQELLEDPHDLLVSLLQKVLPYFVQHRGYVVFILLLLGIVKIVGSVGLMYRKHWGLDLLIILTILLLPFQLYSLFFSFSVSKLIYFTINLLIALYLVEFQPKNYFDQLRHRYQKK